MGSAFSSGNNVAVVLTREESRTETDSDGKSRTVTDYYRGEKTFFHVTAEMCAWRNKELVQPGQYQFPFCVVLPPNAPPSFAIPYGPNPFGAYVEYTASVVCRRPGIFKSNLKHVEALTVLCPPPAPTPGLQPSATEEMEVKRGCCCCFCCSQGGVTLQVSIERDMYLPGEQVLVMVQVTNSSKVAFKRGEVFLQRRLTVSANGGIRRQLDDCLGTVHFEGLSPGATLSGEKALQLRLPIALEAAARPTCVMSLFQHIYQVGVRMKAGACTSDPTLLLTCGIFARLPATAIGGFTPPSADFWKPTVIGQVVNAVEPAAAIGK
ncbi:Arrestin domain-containing protein 2 [Tetrabaena socialis]|uniref:Arrestin domain-containing protein 2 n=1 Tax=Tetrabaena socialis TaxID=47790 RepID=A0A2J7ZS69_9CHLO|nr:Arrestin domain-containing protein 2 [Tetrabaena socialis]|eukprot:PNH03119.1 Arrestin domain-containing protein 2 [Tetrabaena socialis]